MYFLNTNFTRPHITALGSQILHASERQLSQVTMLYTRRYQWHGNISTEKIPCNSQSDQRLIIEAITNMNIAKIAFMAIA